ncbi:MAG: endonuclease III [Nitrospirota bacterium]
MSYDFEHETFEQKKKRAAEIVKLLKKRYPDDPGTELHYKQPLDLLVAAMLSAQCRETLVNSITKTLFQKYKTAKDYAQADTDTLQDEIKAVTFFRNKARNIINMAQALLKDHGGEVPKTMEELVKLPGVGRKTANLILTICFGVPGIVTDTHMIRVTNRLGLTKNKDPEKIERDLYQLIPEKDWIAFSNRLIILGRYTCTARNPNHPECALKDVCPSAFAV